MARFGGIALLTVGVAAGIALPIAARMILLSGLAATYGYRGFDVSERRAFKDTIRMEMRSYRR
jgi:hypothetical protein